MTRRIALGSRHWTLRIEQNNGEVRFRMEEEGAPARAGAASLHAVEPGVYSVLLDGRSHEVRVAREGAQWSVEVGGRRYDVSVEDPRSGRKKITAVGDGRQTLTAAMPGRVVRVLVKEGDTVEAGHGIVVVEAMKMQNEIKAMRPGKVVSVMVSESATVVAGELLAVIE